MSKSTVWIVAIVLAFTSSAALAQRSAAQSQSIVVPAPAVTVTPSPPNINVTTPTPIVNITTPPMTIEIPALDPGTGGLPLLGLIGAAAAVLAALLGTAIASVVASRTLRHQLTAQGDLLRQTLRDEAQIRRVEEREKLAREGEAITAALLAELRGVRGRIDERVRRIKASLPSYKSSTATAGQDEVRAGFFPRGVTPVFAAYGTRLHLLDGEAIAALSDAYGELTAQREALDMPVRRNELHAAATSAIDALRGVAKKLQNAEAALSGEVAPSEPVPAPTRRSAPSLASSRQPDLIEEVGRPAA